MKKHVIITTAAVAALGFTALGSAAGGFATGRVTAPTPEACLVALDEGERALGVSAEALSLAGEAIVAAAEWDIAEITRLTDEIKALADEVDDPSLYLDSAAECRDGAK